MTKKITDIKEFKEKKHWAEVLAEFEKNVEEEANRPLDPIEQKGYNNLKTFIKKLREASTKE